MNLLFQSSHHYTIDRPSDQVEGKLRSIVTRRWDDYSMDVVGFLKRDGSFCITNKWGITRKYRGIDNKGAHITGKLKGDATNTSLKITTGPNRLLLTLFYLSLSLSLFEFSGLESMIPVHPYIKSGLFLLTSLLLLFFMFSHKKSLITRFEDLMQLHAKPAAEVTISNENLLAS